MDASSRLREIMEVDAVVGEYQPPARAKRRRHVARNPVHDAKREIVEEFGDDNGVVGTARKGTRQHEANRAVSRPFAECSGDQACARLRTFGSVKS